MATRIHIALHVTDLPAAIAFYEAMFATPAIRDGDAFAKLVLDEPPINLALTPTRQPGGGALNHLGLQVETADEVAAYGARWDAASLPTKYGDSVAGHPKVWVYDPDGNEWEVFAQ